MKEKNFVVLAISVCIGLLGTITVSQAQTPYINAADVINSPQIRQGKIKSVLISTEFDETERIRLAQALHMLNIYLSHPSIYPSIRNCAVKYVTDKNSLNTDTPYSGTIYSRLGSENVRRYITSSTFPGRAQQEQQKFTKEQAVDNMLLNLAVFGAIAILNELWKR